MEQTLTGDKTPEQLMRELNNAPWTIERQVLPETDYRSLALTEADKLNNSTPQELLSNADKIYQWLTEKPKKR